jgi:hypothetical protein
MSQGPGSYPELGPDWLLAGFDVAAGRFQFARVSRQTYHDSVFLDHRIQPRPAETMSLDCRQVDGVLQNSKVKQSAWIFHTGFCGSTLLATCLDHPGHTLVLREPLVLSRLAHELRVNPAQNAIGTRALADRVIGLCERSYAGEALLVKPSNSANSLLGLVKAHDSAMVRRKAVLLSCGLESLLVSILKKRSEAESLLPGFVNALLQDSDYLAMSGLPGTEGLDLLQLAVVFWHCQRHFLQQQLLAVSKGEILKLGMERFLAEPLPVLAEVSAFLGLGLPAEMLRETVESGAFRRHSKQALTDYSPDEYHREQREIRERYAAELEIAMDWAAPLLARLPIEPFRPA